MSSRNGAADTPRLVADDKLTVSARRNGAAASGSPGDAAARVESALNQMSAFGPDAEAGYQRILRDLARDPQAAVAAIADQYQQADEDQYTLRWSQVHLLSELRDGAALPAFDRIVSAPIPPEKAPDMNIYSTVGEEVMIRTTAIEGVTRLAAAGNKDALELLRKHTGHESFSVRRAAVQGYLEAGGSGAREELLKTLPESDRFILDIRRMDVRDVPQPRVERAPSGKRDDAPSPQMSRPRMQK